MNLTHCSRDADWFYRKPWRRKRRRIRRRLSAHALPAGVQMTHGAISSKTWKKTSATCMLDRLVHKRSLSRWNPNFCPRQNPPIFSLAPHISSARSARTTSGNETSLCHSKNLKYSNSKYLVTSAGAQGSCHYFDMARGSPVVQNSIPGFGHE